MKLSNYRNILITRYGFEPKKYISTGFRKMGLADLILVETYKPHKFIVKKNRYGNTDYQVTLDDIELAKLYLVTEVWDA